MNKKQIDELQKKLQNNLGSRWKVEPTSQVKVGGVKFGFSCSFEGENTSTIIYPNDYKHMLDEGTSMSEVAEYIAQDLTRERRVLLTSPQTKEDFKEGLFVQLINTPINSALLETAVHDSVIGDISAIARCKVHAPSDDEIVSFIVTKDNMSLFQMTQSEIMAQAYKNTANQSFTIQDMRDLILEGLTQAGVPKDMLPDIRKDEGKEMYVITNEDRVNGANAMICPQIFQDIFKELGEPFYVLPSSTHELIVVKESIDMTPEDLKHMVHDVNMRECSADELLSFDIFRYDGKKLSIAMEDTETISEAIEKAKSHKLTH